MRSKLKFIIVYGLAMAAAALLLDWLQVQFLLKHFSLEIYVLVLCGFFTALGIWIGAGLTRRRPVAAFTVNHAAQAYLNISDREHEVLVLLAAGHSNQEIAGKLFVSPYRIPVTFVEIFPVGILVSLVSALLLKDSRRLAAA